MQKQPKQAITEIKEEKVNIAEMLEISVISLFINWLLRGGITLLK